MANTHDTLTTALVAVQAELDVALKDASHEDETGSKVGSSTEVALLQAVVSRVQEAVGAYDRFIEFLNPPEDK